MGTTHRTEFIDIYLHISTMEIKEDFYVPVTSLLSAMI